MLTSEGGKERDLCAGMRPRHIAVLQAITMTQSAWDQRLWQLSQTLAVKEQQAQGAPDEDEGESRKGAQKAQFW